MCWRCYIPNICTGCGKPLGSTHRYYCTHYGYKVREADVITSEEIDRMKQL